MCIAENCSEVYQNSNEEITCILLKQSKKLFYNIDALIVMSSLTATLKKYINDENKRAQIEFFFHSQNKQRVKI